MESSLYAKSVEMMLIAHTRIFCCTDWQKEGKGVCMKRSGMDEMLEKIARSNNTTPEQVRREMEAAIDVMMENQDESKRVYRISLIGHEGRPTVDEFITALANTVKAKGVN